LFSASISIKTNADFQLEHRRQMAQANRLAQFKENVSRVMLSMSQTRPQNFDTFVSNSIAYSSDEIADCGVPPQDLKSMWDIIHTKTSHKGTDEPSIHLWFAQNLLKSIDQYLGIGYSKQQHVTPIAIPDYVVVAKGITHSTWKSAFVFIEIEAENNPVLDTLFNDVVLVHIVLR
jgi:hypothetical protein